MFRYALAAALALIGLLTFSTQVHPVAGIILLATAAIYTAIAARLEI